MCKKGIDKKWENVQLLIHIFPVSLFKCFIETIHQVNSLL